MAIITLRETEYFAESQKNIGKFSTLYCIVLKFYIILPREENGKKTLTDKNMKLKVLGLCAFLAIPAFGQEEKTDSLTVPGYDLDEFVIEAERPVMQSDGAKLTYNVTEDPAAGSSNALDILKKVPQITVDGDGNIRLNGSQAYKLQVNGLENPMMQQYAGQILQAMPANAIVKIEVITEPGAREDAEGVAGIINIITERSESKDGYSGSLSLQVDNRGLTPSLYGISKKDKVTLSANLYYQWGFSPQKGENRTTAYYPDSGMTLNSITGQKSKHQLVGGTLNMSWEPNPDNLFTAGANIFYLDATLRSLFNNSEMFAAGVADSPIWSFRQDGSGSMKMLNVSANASYKHNFRGSQGNTLVLSYLFNYGKTDIWIDRMYSETFNYTPDYMYQSQGSSLFNRGHTVQADYSNDFNSAHHKLDVGAKGIFRHNTALADYLNGNSADQLMADPLMDSSILQPQNIYAGYASYTGSYSKLGVVAGLRYEHTLMGITDWKDGAKSFRNHLNDWVPNAALTWNFSAASNLRLAYQMRISRPSIDQVNPFSLSFSPYEVRRGNIDLTSERNHIVSLKYSSFGRVVGGSVGVEYNRSDNAISSFTYLERNGNINTIVTTFANIGKKQDVALTALFNWGIIHNMNLTLTGRMAYSSIKETGAPEAGLGLPGAYSPSNHGWTGNIGMNWNYSAAEVYKFSAYGMWNSRSINLQGYNSGFYYYGISASRDFLKDKSLTLGISANNFAQRKMKFAGHTVTPNVVTDTKAYNLTTWRVGVSVTWKFGSLKSQVKKTGVEIKNDDINSTSNQSQGSSLPVN